MSIQGVVAQWPTQPTSIGPNTPFFGELTHKGAAAPVGQQQLLLLDKGFTTCGSMTALDDIDMPTKQLCGFHPKGVASVSPDGELVLLVNPDSTLYLFRTNSIAAGETLAFHICHSPNLFGENLRVVWSSRCHAAVVWCEKKAIFITESACRVIDLPANTCAMALCGEGLFPDAVVCVEADRGHVHVISFTNNSIYRLTDTANVLDVVTHGSLVCLRTGDRMFIISNIYTHISKTTPALSTMQSTERNHLHFHNNSLGITHAMYVDNVIGNPCIHPLGKIVCVPQKDGLLFIQLDENNEPKKIVNSPFLTNVTPFALSWSRDGTHLAFLNTRPLNTSCFVSVKVESGTFGFQFSNLYYYIDAVLPDVLCLSETRIIWSPFNIILASPVSVCTWPLFSS